MKTIANAETKTAQKMLGQRIRATRKAKGWSQTALAASCKLHVSHFSKVERGGANATLSTLLAIAAALETTLADLLLNISIVERLEE